MFTGYKTLIIDGSEMITSTTTWTQFFNMIKELFETTLGYTATVGEYYNPSTSQGGKYFTLPTLEGVNNVEGIPCIVVQKYRNSDDWSTTVSTDSTGGIFYDLKDRDSSVTMTVWAGNEKIQDHYASGISSNSFTSAQVNINMLQYRYRFSFYAMSSKSFLINELCAPNDNVTLAQLEDFTPIYDKAFTPMEKDGVVKNVAKCFTNGSSFGNPISINFISGSQRRSFSIETYTYDGDSDSVCLNELIVPNWGILDMKIVEGNNSVIRKYFEISSTNRTAEGVKDGIIIDGVHYLGVFFYSSGGFTIFKKP